MPRSASNCLNRAEDISRDNAEEDVQWVTQSENATLLRRVDELIFWDCQIRTGVLSPINCRMLFTCSRWRALKRGGRGRLELSFFIVIGLSTGILVASLLKKAVKVKFIIFFCSFHNKGWVLLSFSSQDVQLRFINICNVFETIVSIRNTKFYKIIKCPLTIMKNIAPLKSMPHFVR